MKNENIWTNKTICLSSQTGVSAFFLLWLQLILPLHKAFFPVYNCSNSRALCIQGASAFNDLHRGSTTPGMFSALSLLQKLMLAKAIKTILLKYIKCFLLIRIATLKKVLPTTFIGVLII